jgi:hypothetical protein
MFFNNCAGHDRAAARLRDRVTFHIFRPVCGCDGKTYATTVPPRAGRGAAQRGAPSRGKCPAWIAVAVTACIDAV